MSSLYTASGPTSRIGVTCLRYGLGVDNSLQLSEPSAADDSTIVVSNCSIDHKKVGPVR
jgi:hypothetical protein